MRPSTKKGTEFVKQTTPRKKASPRNSGRPNGRPEFPHNPLEIRRNRVDQILDLGTLGDTGDDPDRLRRSRVLELTKQGLSQYRIAVLVGAHRSTIQRDQRWLATGNPQPTPTYWCFGKDCDQDPVWLKRLKGEYPTVWCQKHVASPPP